MAAAQTGGRAATLFVSGVVSIGIVTALFLPGRQTVQGVKAFGTAGSGLLGTAIKG
jgi:hypothetical protein